MSSERHLSIEEKRTWLAEVFRDRSGEYSLSDKFKAMAEDNKLAQLLADEEKKVADNQAEKEDVLDLSLLVNLPPPYEG